MNTKPKLKILFLCTGNSCRSQMAEGWAKHLKSEVIDAFSAGTQLQGLNPNAVKVMAEVGVDISNHTSKHLNDLSGITFDFLVTVCGDADQKCPHIESVFQKIHVGFEDPPKLALHAKSFEEKLQCYRKVRDEIRNFVEKFPEEFQNKI